MIEVTKVKFLENTSEYLQSVQEGEMVVLLENDQPLARLIAMTKIDCSTVHDNTTKNNTEEKTIKVSKQEFLNEFMTHIQNAQKGHAVAIIENGQEVARLIAMDSPDFVRSLLGVIKGNYTDEEVKELYIEELRRKYESLD